MFGLTMISRARAYAFAMYADPAQVATAATPPLAADKLQKLVQSGDDAALGRYCDPALVADVAAAAPQFDRSLRLVFAVGGAPVSFFSTNSCIY
jgi:hypothetical protein